MPRNSGTGVYEQPAPDVITATTIESAVYNAFVNDVETDLNTPRPIVAGGTGTSDAAQARINLQAEVSGQMVTNYDSHVWQNGSFWSDPSATGAPVAAYLSGVCDMHDETLINLEAREFHATDLLGQKYSRQKVTGVWRDWQKDGSRINTSGDEGFAATTGDMWYGVRSGAPFVRFAVNTESDLSGYDIFQVHKGSGNVVLLGSLMVGSATAGTIYLNSAATASLGWTSTLGFGLSGSPLETSHGITTGGDITVTKNQTSAPTQGTIYFGNTGTKYLFYDGTDFSLSGGSLLVAGPVNATYINASQNISATGTITASGAITGVGLITAKAFSATTNAYHAFQDNTGVNRGHLYWNYANADISIQNAVGDELKINYFGYTTLGKAFYGRAGTAAASSANGHNFFWTGSVLQAWMDAANLGTVTITSDYRIKKDVIDLPGMWDTVKAMRPIKYTQAQYTPPTEVRRKLEQALAAREAKLDVPEAKEGAEITPMFVADDIERWGFVAHELQEALLPTAASGVKDAPDEVQSLNLAPVVAALTKALQEAMARIEALEQLQPEPAP